MKNKIKLEIDRQKVNAMMGEHYKQEPSKPKIHIEENLPKGVESEWGRLLRDGKIKKYKF